MKIYPDGSGGYMLRGDRGFAIPLESVTGGGIGTVDIAMTEAELLAALADPGSPVATAVSGMATGSPPGHIPLTPNEPYDSSSLFWSLTITTLTMMANRLYAVPFRLENAETIADLRVKLTTGAAGSLRAGIYGMSANGLPHALLAETEAINANTTGMTWFGLSPAVALDAGIYFLGLVSDATPQLTGFTANSDQILSEGGVYASHRWTNHPFGPLPNPFGTAFYATTAGPLVMFQVT